MRYHDLLVKECAYQLAVGIPEFGIWRPGFITEAAARIAEDWKDSGIKGLPTPAFVMNWWEANKNDYAL